MNDLSANTRVQRNGSNLKPKQCKIKGRAVLCLLLQIQAKAVDAPNITGDRHRSSTQLVTGTIVSAEALYTRRFLLDRLLHAQNLPYG